MTPVYQLLELGPLPLEIEYLKARLQIETADLDEAAVQVIDEDVRVAQESAVDYVERQTHLDLRAKTWAAEFCGWPCFPLVFEKGPVRDVISIGYLDSDGAPLLLDADLWGWQRRGDRVAIYLVDQPALPGISRRPDAVKIGLSTGFYGPADPDLGGSPPLAPPPALLLPGGLLKAATLLTGHFYEHRDAVQEERSYEVELGADNLLASQRLFL